MGRIAVLWAECGQARLSLRLFGWHSSGMKNTFPKTDQDATRQGDRIAFIAVSVFTLLSWVVLSVSDVTDARRINPDASWQEFWVLQFTSHLAVLIAVLVMPIMLRRYPVSLENWLRRLPIYLAGFFLFGVVHISLMMAFREVSFPIVLGRGYNDSLTDMSRWIYELSKDAYTYLLILSVFISARHIEGLQLEMRASRDEAKETGRLTLKSGGRIVFLDAAEVVWAKAAQNYVEIHTGTGAHLVRMTLSNLETLLHEAGAGHIRTHRSHIVKHEHIREIIPTGDGDANLRLTSGREIPVSRKYRQSVEAI